MHRLSILAGLLLLSVLWIGDHAPAAAETYKDYALRLVRNPPKGTRFRPDLEAYLNTLASSARRKKDKRGLTASKLLRTAARAQALEMLQGNYVGHRSKSGYRFSARFEAFAGDERGTYGENAARDRQAGSANKAKARRLFQQWIDSRGHRRNLMRHDYRYVSTGVIQRGNHIYAVQMFWER